MWKSCLSRELRGPRGRTGLFQVASVALYVPSLRIVHAGRSIVARGQAVARARNFQYFGEPERLSARQFIYLFTCRLRTFWLYRRSGVADRLRVPFMNMSGARLKHSQSSTLPVDVNASGISGNRACKFDCTYGFHKQSCEGIGLNLMTTLVR